jgi:hypothetical protein
MSTEPKIIEHTHILRQSFFGFSEDAAGLPDKTTQKKCSEAITELILADNMKASMALKLRLTP